MKNLCECGCGQQVKLCKINDSSRGLKKGTPNRFIYGHNKANLGGKHSIESKLKMKKSRERYYNFVRGKSYEDLYGVEKAKIIKLKISKNRIAPKGSKCSWFGKENKWGRHTEEAIKKISESSKNRKYSQKIKKLRSDAMKERRKNIVYPSKDTSIEVKIQDFLTLLKIEYIAHKYINIEHGYQCDIFIPSMKLIIECDGDYWHGNPNIYSDEQLTERILNQRILDKLRTQELQERGFSVIRLWEVNIKAMNINKFDETIRKYFQNGNKGY